jgi:hypothetical protein
MLSLLLCHSQGYPLCSNAPYGAKILPDTLELSPGQRIELTNHVRNGLALQSTARDTSIDGWLIALDGLSPRELDSLSNYQRAAVRTRMKKLGLPPKRYLIDPTKRCRIRTRVKDTKLASQKYINLS